MFNNKKIEDLRLNLQEMKESLTIYMKHTNLRHLTAKEEIDSLHERIKKLESTKKPKVKS